MSADLNPNRAGNLLAVSDVSGLSSLTVTGPDTQITVAQLGNVIDLQLSGAVAATAAADSVIALETDLDNTDALVARMLPSGTPFVPVSVYETTTPSWFTASAQLSVNGDNKLQIVLAAPSGTWPVVELNLNGMQIHYMAEAQATRDFNVVV